MRARRLPLYAWPLVALLVPASPIPAQEAGKNGGEVAVPEQPPAPAGPRLPGFVYVPAGKVFPGCTYEDYENRHRGNDKLRKELLYEVWGAQEPFALPAFHIGRHEVTNAQWKLYLDKTFRREHTTEKGETLKSIALRYVKFRDEGVESEWRSVYAFNLDTLVEAWKKMQVKDAQGNEAPAWNPAWDPQDPPNVPGNDVAELELPPGLKLHLYAHRAPEHWYGWLKLAHLRVGREYCDITKPFDEAFKVPEGPPFDTLDLRDKDFGAYPVRSVSPNEMLAFAEWAGCHLPTEYEFERAGAGDNLDWPHTFGPKWDHSKEKNLFPWADSDRFPTSKGPFRVDDERAARSDSFSGARMLHGNMWELTSTFYDLHPFQTPAPPTPDHGLVNYTLVAKGGSYGDAWQLQQLSTRTCLIGNAELSLRHANKADTLGLRLVRHHDRPGYDLLRHSILTISYDPGAAVWNEYLPHSFALDLMAGVDEVFLADAEAPYAHVVGQASAIAFAPLWITELDDGFRRDCESKWKSGKAERRAFRVLGILRSDVPLKGGVRLNDQEARNLIEERKSYEKFMKEYKDLPEAKKRNIVKLPDPPLQPDEYEKLTEKNQEECGIWRGKEVPPGEWLVVYWNGFIGLANKALTMPPDAIFLIADARKSVSREQKPPAPARLTLSPESSTVRLQFMVNEQATDKRKQRQPPREAKSSLWALLDVLPELWTGGDKGLQERRYSWSFDVTLPVVDGALARHAWRSAEAAEKEGK